tara:strand:+ start:757 stop:960 length:204 start_codon:yes stop_codon:yes gene_type:complete
MLGGEIVAIISVSIAGVSTLLSTCFHSRCIAINWGWGCITCTRRLMDDDDDNNSNQKRLDEVEAHVV